MSSVVIFFTAVIAAIVSKNIANSVNIQDVDVDKLLNIVQQKRFNRYDTSDDSDSSDSDSSDQLFYSRSSKTEEDNIIDTLNQLFNKKSNKQVNRDRRNRQEKPNNLVRVQNNNNQNSQRSEDIANILSVLLNNDLKTESESQSRSLKKHLTPNRLLGDGNNRNVDLQDYSKIYVLLTPKAIQKTKFNHSGINQLISKILSLSTSPTNRNRQVPQKQKRYKGFVVNDPVRRRRGSREMYAPNDSVEDKPKRGRNNGGGGHTAIPYIRHRGDNIYEKDS